MGHLGGSVRRHNAVWGTATLHGRVHSPCVPNSADPRVPERPPRTRGWEGRSPTLRSSPPLRPPGGAGCPAATVAADSRRARSGRRRPPRGPRVRLRRAEGVGSRLPEAAAAARSRAGVDPPEQQCVAAASCDLSAAAGQGPLNSGALRRRRPWLLGAWRGVARRRRPDAA